MSRQLQGVIRHLQRVAARTGGGALTDAELVQRFVEHRDEAAFELLVWRHGALVLGTCRRLLGNVQDVEDAFQATFLALVRQAKSIGKRQAVAGWLYRVAYRTALRSRRLSAKRRRVESRAAGPSASNGSALASAELRHVLDDELTRLPERYRVPFLLCYVEGKTTEEAARQLGCPRGTVLSRLATARERLRAQLSRRGVTLTAVALSALVVEHAAAAGLSSALVDATMKLAGALAAGKGTGAVAPHILALTEGVVHAMLVNRLKIAAAFLVAVGLLGLGTSLLTRQATASVPARAAPAQKPPPLKPKEDHEIILGTWDVVSVIDDGEKRPLREQKYIFTKTHIAFKNRDRLGRDIVTYRLDPSQKPKAIDLDRADRPDEETSYGIYRLEGDELTLCVSERNQAERPSAFESVRGSRTRVLVLKRSAKPETVPDEKIREVIEDSKRRRHNIRSMMKLYLGISAYEEEHGRLPAAAIYSKDGKPLLSWRVTLLPYIEQGELYRQFKLDEPWDSEHNLKLLPKIPEVFTTLGAKTKEDYVTAYRVFTGPDTAFEGKDGLKLGDLTDGRDTTLLLVEAAEAVPWTKPAELPYDPTKPLPKLGGSLREHFPIITASGAGHYLPLRFNDELFRALITRNDGKAVAVEDLQK